MVRSDTSYPHGGNPALTGPLRAVADRRGSARVSPVGNLAIAAAPANGRLRFSRQVYAAEPYASKDAQDVENERDGILGQSDGTTLLDARPSSDGYAATFSIALQTT